MLAQFERQELSTEPPARSKVISFQIQVGCCLAAALAGSATVGMSIAAQGERTSGVFLGTIAAFVLLFICVGMATWNCLQQVRDYRKFMARCGARDNLVTTGGRLAGVVTFLLTWSTLTTMTAALLIGLVIGGSQYGWLLGIGAACIGGFVLACVLTLTQIVAALEFTKRPLLAWNDVGLELWLEYRDGTAKEIFLLWSEIREVLESRPSRLLILKRNGGELVVDLNGASRDLRFVFSQIAERAQRGY